MKPKYRIIHHTASSRDKTTLSDVNRWHKARGFPKSKLGYYVGYHFLILGNGVINQTRKDDEIGVHARDGGMNKKSIGICLTGNFENEKPNKIQLESLAKLLNMIDDKYPALPVIPHRDIPSQTACCGKHLIEWLKRINWYLPSKDTTKEELISLAESMLTKLKKL